MSRPATKASPGSVRAHLIYVGDDAATLSLIAEGLRDIDPRVIGPDALSAPNTVRGGPDFIVLRQMMGGFKGGYDRLKAFCSNACGPVIFLATRWTVQDRIDAIQAGAEDVIDLLSGFGNIVNRTRLVMEGNQGIERWRPVEFAGWRVDPLFQTVHSPTFARIAMSPAEFDLFLLFARRPDVDHAAEDLECRIALAGHGSANIESLVARLRQKIEADPEKPRLLTTTGYRRYRLETRYHAPASTRQTM